MKHSGGYQKRACRAWAQAWCVAGGLACGMTAWAADEADQCPVTRPDAPHHAVWARFDQELRAALAARDAAALALLVRFPLEVRRDGGRVRIEDPVAWQQAFDALWTPARVQAVLQTRWPSQNCGSDALGYADGQVWAELDAEAGVAEPRIVALRLDAPGVRAGPQFVCRTPKYRVLVDQIGSARYRYRSWNQPHSLSVAPDLTLEAGPVAIGVSGTGACAAQSWTFRSGPVVYELTERGCTDRSVPAWVRGMLSVNVQGREVASAWCE